MLNRFKHFSGRIIQVIETLDNQHKISEQLLHLNFKFSQEYRLRTEIYAKNFHPALNNFVSNIDDLTATEQDIVFFYDSENANQIIKKITDLKTTKIFIQSQTYQPNATDKFHRVINNDQYKILEILFALIPEASQYQKISIIICTYNRADLLARCLDYLQYQTSPAFEVIVVNGPSTDHTDHVLAEYKNKIKIATNPLRNLSISRNIGIELASGEIIAFIDDDALPFDHWVEIVLKAYNSLPITVAGVGGATFYAGSLDFQVQDSAIDLEANIFFDIDKKSYQSKQWLRFLLGTNASFKKQALIDINGFDEQYDYNSDETDLCVRLQQKNYLLHYQENLYLRHEYAQSAHRQSKYQFNWQCITKNTAYFITKFNPERSYFEIIKIICKHSYRDRLKLFWKGFTKKELNITALLSNSAATLSGIFQGLWAARKPRRLRILKPQNNSWLPFINANPINPQKLFHIAIITNEFGHFTKTGGNGTQFYHLASELLQMGHKISVIIPGHTAEHYQRGNFNLYRVPIEHIFNNDINTWAYLKYMHWSLSAAKKILEIHQEFKIDIIESTLWECEAYAVTLLPIKIPTIVRLVTPFKLVNKIHQIDLPKLDIALCEQAEKTMIQRADAVIAISDSIAQTIQTEFDVQPDHRWHRQSIGIAYWPQSDVFSGYNAISHLNKKLINIPPTAFKILFLGRLEKRKGIDILLNAAEQCLAKDSDIYFIIAGAGDANAHLNHERIIFLGEIPVHHKDKLYAFCDVFVFPSRYESFGLVTLEAFVHGKPVIASTSGAIPEVVQDGISGLLFQENNDSELADLILKLKNDPELYKNLANGAKQRIKTLSSRNMAIQSVNLYNAISVQKTKNLSFVSS